MVCVGLLCVEVQQGTGTLIPVKKREANLGIRKGNGIKTQNEKKC